MSFILIVLIDLYSLVVFVAVALSWLRLSRENPVVRLTARLTEPVLAPLRRALPDTGGIDFSPLVLLILLQLLKRLLGG